MNVGNTGNEADKREAARNVNKPVAPRMPHTGMNKAKDQKHIDSFRGRGPGSGPGGGGAPKGGNSVPRRGGARGR